MKIINSKGISTVAIVGIVVIVLLAGGLVWWQVGKVDNENTNANGNTNATINVNNTSNINGNVNSNSNSNTNTVSITNGVSADWKIYKDITTGLEFTFPAYLNPRENYPNYLISSESNPTVESIKVTQLTQADVGGFTSNEKYVDDVSLELSGTFQAVSVAHQQTFNKTTGVIKEYKYHSSLGDSGPYNQKAVLFLVQKNTRYELLEIRGINNQEFDGTIDTVLSSVVF